MFWNNVDNSTSARSGLDLESVMGFGNGKLILKNNIKSVYTVRNVRKFTKFVCYKSNVKFDEMYDVFEKRYLEIAKIVFSKSKSVNIYWLSVKSDWFK